MGVTTVRTPWGAATVRTMQRDRVAGAVVGFVECVPCPRNFLREPAKTVHQVRERYSADRLWSQPSIVVLPSGLTMQRVVRLSFFVVVREWSHVQIIVELFNAYQ